MPARPGASKTHLVPWHPTASTDEERREFLQDRITVYARIAFLIFLGLSVFVSSSLLLIPQLRPERAHVLPWFAAGGPLLLGMAWMFARRGARSIPTLYTLDTAIALVFGVYFGLLVYVVPDRPHNVYLPFVFCTLIVVGRFVIVPSRGTRTLLVASATMVPLTLSYVALAINAPQYHDVPPLAASIGVTIISAAVVLLAWTGSRVIYGLRARAREGDQLGQYTLDEIIGEGGMGTVYRANHALLRRPTAIKLLRPDNNSEVQIARFQQEVQLTSELTHPNTIAIYDYGTTPDGVFYYVMEHLDGVDLQKLVARSGPQPASRVIHILRQVCSALAEAHGRGLIHRDIKPANIILCQLGEVPDVVKIVDFGLVKEQEKNSNLTGAGIAGTPAYLSPEAIHGPDSVTALSDIYAIGCTAYYLLTGDTVFEASGTAEMCLHHVETDPTPPSERANVSVPTELEGLLLQCLAKNPRDRPTDARTIYEALSHLAHTHEWDEAKALSWWSDFAAHESDGDAQDHTLESSAVSMSIDLSKR
jgi:serine/threonine-protein kinase